MIIDVQFKFKLGDKVQHLSNWDGTYFLVIEKQIIFNYDTTDNAFSLWYVCQGVDGHSVINNCFREQELRIVEK